MPNSDLYVSKSTDYQEYKAKKGTSRSVKRRKTKMAKLEQKVNLLAINTQPEKKRKTFAVAAQLVGQVNVNQSGYYVADITPLAASSTTYGGRTGSSIRLKSSYIQMQLFGMSSTSANIKGRILIFKTDSYQSSPSTFVTNMLNLNTFVNGGFAIYDFNSSYNPDYFKEWKLIREKKFTFRPDNITNQNMITTLGFGLKYNRGQGHIIRYNKDSTTVIEGQIIMLILVDNGNIGATACTYTNVPVIAANTGLNLNYNIENYYYDV